MNRITRLGLCAATGLAATLCYAPQASAATPTDGAMGPKASNGHEKVLHLTARATQITGVDLPPPGTSQGDELIVAGDLLKSNTTVGGFDEVCAMTRIGPNNTNTLQCQITLSLPKGQITVQGVFTISNSGPGDITLAITGGTGKYRTAHGFVHAVNTSQTDTDLTVHLIL